MDNETTLAALAAAIDKMNWSRTAKNEVVVNGARVALGYSGGHEYWIKVKGRKYTYLCATCEELAEAVMMYCCDAAGRAKV
jgi:hypothetical protein